MGLIILAYGLVAVAVMGYLFGLTSYEKSVRTIALLSVLTSAASAVVGYYFGRGDRR
jgi:uncharacterized membrane protein